MSSDRNWIPWAVLIVGVLSASASAILIRYADDAHPLAISFWRCALGSAALALFARKGLARVTEREVRISVLAGVFLAAHFATWIWSVRLTSVAASVLLVSTTPIFVAILARWIFDERLTTVGWAGIALAMAGVAAIAVSANGGNQDVTLAGNLLALAGGATVAGYALGGRIALRTLDIFGYAVLAYGAAGVLLLAACLIAGADLTGYPSDTWWAIAAIVIGPQLMGHTLINLSLKDIDTTTVSMVLLAEPVIATALAFALFDESPSAWVYPAGLAILIGVVMVSRARREPVVISE